MISCAEKLADMLGVQQALLERLDDIMVHSLGRTGVLDRVVAENEVVVKRALQGLGLPPNPSAGAVREALREAARLSEIGLLERLRAMPGRDDFEKAAQLAKKVATVGRGFFLKREYGAGILKKSKPAQLLKFLGHRSVEELLKKYDVAEIFSALRFVETQQWMHDTFEKAYSDFTAEDFEDREIEIKVLGPEWHEVAEKFVAKKHHNVSHLKEFGVIFLNPIKENVQGKFVRDFALLLHYFHEIEFYSKLFRLYAGRENFAEHFKALLRGDVNEVTNVKDGEWLIVQRYLFKENPRDPRLLLPRVNPESMHWFRGERDIVRLADGQTNSNLAMWLDRDWVGCVHEDGDREVISFDLEDNAMALVSVKEGGDGFFNYHQREALWTKLFMEYAGGEKDMEELLLENFDRGIVAFK